MTPREVAAWIELAEPRLKAQEALRFRLANIAAQGDGKAINSVAKALAGENE